jgi:hypothetical protein
VAWRAAPTIVRTFLFLLAVVVVLALGAVWISQQQRRVAQDQWTCSINLRRLGIVWKHEVRRGSPLRSGPALFLGWRKSSLVISGGEERVLLCPEDAAAVDLTLRNAPSRWDDVDLDAPAPGLCSYAVRDFAAFPLIPNAPSPQPIAACLHHAKGLFGRRGAIVLYDSGTVEFEEFPALGISDLSELTVGPQSKSALLRPLTFGPGR